MTYEDWMTAHSGIFGMIRPEDTNIVAMWAQLGQHMGATPEQMLDASFALAATGKAPDFRDALQRAWVQTLRAELARSRPPGRAEEPAARGCRLCDETGRVLAPNPDTLRRGGWTTLAVLCRCPLGMWFRSGSGKTGQGMTLEQLERELPDWAARVRAHHAEQVAYAQAQAAAGAVRTRLSFDADRLVADARKRSQRS